MSAHPSRPISAVIVMDAQGRTRWINERCSRITGYTLEEMIGKTPGELLHGPKTDKSEEARIRATMQAGEAVTAELMNYSKDRREYMMRIEIEPMRDDAGAITGFMAVKTDLSERDKAVAELRDQKEVLQNVIDNIPCAVFWKDRNSINLGGNQLAARDSGYASATEMIGKSTYDLQISREEAESYIKFDRQVMDNGVPILNIEETLTKPDGSRIDLLTSKVPLRDRVGEVVGVLAIYLDITERKRAQVEIENGKIAAEAANHAKSQFLANMSHEIRTPLTAILGYADLLREESLAQKGSGGREEIIDTICAAGQHLLAVINNILDLSKIEADRMDICREDTSLVALLVEVESFVRPKAIAKQISFTVNIESGVPERIISASTHLRQIITNLAANAVKFTDRGSVTIHVRVAGATGTRLQIDVEDTGPGMTPEQAAQLFSPFVQVDSGMARRFGGTGLGLTISRRLAILMGGNVTLERTKPGAGSLFRLDLPLEAASETCLCSGGLTGLQQAARMPTVTNIRLSGRILLAEDGQDNQRLICFHLRKAGAEVDVAGNGRIALQMLDQAQGANRPYDLLLTDMAMPEMDGYELAQRVRKNGSHLPIVALTAHAMAEDRAKCLAAGCDDYASKPIDKVQLLTTCANWMAKYIAAA